MKAITLWQPWATLVALGEKTNETRSWSTNHRGKLAIHAAKSIKGIDACGDTHIRQALLDAGYLKPGDLPFGKVLCVVELVDVYPVEEVWGDLTEEERSFGNYAAGRFAWELKMIEVFDRPILAQGKQGLWGWYWQVGE